MMIGLDPQVATMFFTKLPKRSDQSSSCGSMVAQIASCKSCPYLSMTASCSHNPNLMPSAFFKHFWIMYHLDLKFAIAWKVDAAKPSSTILRIVYMHMIVHTVLRYHIQYLNCINIYIYIKLGRWYELYSNDSWYTYLITKLPLQHTSRVWGVAAAVWWVEAVAPCPPPCQPQGENLSVAPVWSNDSGRVSLGKPAGKL